MSNEAIGIIVAFLAAHGAAVWAGAWKFGNMFVDRLLKWRDMEHAIQDVKNELSRHIEAQKEKDAKFEADLNAAFGKIRNK